MRAFILRRVGFIRDARGGVVLIGPGHSGDTLRLQRFLTRNSYPHRLLDTDADPDADGFLRCFKLDEADLPVVISPDHRVFRNPTTAHLADDLGLTEAIDPARIYDVAVVGAGPAGLAAAVYAASEGLDTIVIEGNRAWRAGRHEFEDRELPRLSDRDLGSGAGRPSPGPGAEIRGAACDLARCRLAALRRASLQPRPAGRRLGDGADRGGRDRRALSQARRAGLRPVRRTGHPLRRDRHGGASVHRRGGDRGRRRQFGRPGRHVPVAHGRACAHPGPRPGAGRHHVGLFGPPHRQFAEDHAACADRGHRARGRPLSARRQLDQPGVGRTRAPCRGQSLRDDRSSAQYRMARRLPRPRRGRLRTHRGRPDRGAPRLALRDKPSRDLCGGRRPGRIGEAGRLGGRRGLRRGAGAPPASCIRPVPETRPAGVVYRPSSRC